MTWTRLARTESVTAIALYDGRYRTGGRAGERGVTIWDGHTVSRPIREGARYHFQAMFLDGPWLVVVEYPKEGRKPDPRLTRYDLRTGRVATLEWSAQLPVPILLEWDLRDGTATYAAVVDGRVCAVLVDVATFEGRVGFCARRDGWALVNPFLSADSVTYTEQDPRHDEPDWRKARLGCQRLLTAPLSDPTRAREPATVRPCRTWSGVTVGGATVSSSLTKAQLLAGAFTTGEGWLSTGGRVRSLGLIDTDSLRYCAGWVYWTTENLRLNSDTGNRYHQVEIRRWRAGHPVEVVYRAGKNALVSTLQCQNDEWLAFSTVPDVRRATYFEDQMAAKVF